MMYEKQYLRAMDDSERGGFYLFRKFFPKKLIQKNSKKHSYLFQMKRWIYLKECNKILDVGCGLGNFIRTNPFKIEVWGMDKIKDSIKELEKEGIPAKVGDINKKFPFADNSFDGLTCFHVLEHIIDPSNALSEMKRVIKKDGLLVIAVPVLSFKRFYDDYTHIKPYTKKSLYKLLKDYNFKDIKIKNGSYFNQLISSLFFFFPKIRFSIEELLGNIHPLEIIAIARNNK